MYARYNAQNAQVGVKSLALVLMFGLVGAMLPFGGFSSAQAALDVAPNPTLSNACGLDIALVLDNSNSINSTELGQMKTALAQFCRCAEPSHADLVFGDLFQQARIRAAGLHVECRHHKRRY